MNIYTTNPQNYRDIAGAIRAANGTDTAYLPGEMAGAIDVIRFNRTEAPEKDVNFIDYDGAILYSYTVDEFLALSTMPEPPVHPGLVFQTWNWTLAGAKEFAGKYGKVGELWIGALYITDDGSTRLYCHISEDILHLYCGFAVDGTVEIDWGDNTGTDTVTGSDLNTIVFTPHTYATPGDYTIVLTVTSGSMAIVGSSATNTGCGLLNINASDVMAYVSRAYTGAIRKVHIGRSCSVRDHAFRYCYNLEAVTIPNSITSLGIYAFQYCLSLTSFTFPLSQLTSTGSYLLGYCYSLVRLAFGEFTVITGSSFRNLQSLRSVTIPTATTTLPTYAFNTLYSAVRIVITENVSTMNASAFSAARALRSLWFYPTTPPALESSNVFNNLPSSCKIYVPTASLDAYKSATNYPSSSTYTYIGF